MPTHASTGAPTGLSPSERLLWDSLDVSLRDRATVAGSDGLEVGAVARRLGGGATTGGFMVGHGALATLGYAPWSEPAFLPTPASPAMQALGCWTFDPSASRDNCTTDCLDEMAESGSGWCDGFLDCGSGGVARSLDGTAMDTMAVEVLGSESLGFVRGPLITRGSDTDQGLIRAAWNMVLDNMDLVAWAVCKVTGSVSTTEFGRLQDRINGKRPRRVTVRVMDTGGTALALYGTDYILIAGLGDMWTQFTDLWSRGDDDTRLCALVSAAAMILHELSHLAGYTYADRNYEEKCYTSIMIGSAFHWGLHQRYPNASNPSCCSHLAGGWTFGCGRSPAILDGCTLGAVDDTGGYFGGGGGVGKLAFDFVRWVVGAAIGAIRRGISELAGLLWELTSRAWDTTVDWAAGMVGRIADWWDSMSAGSGTGGGCGCDCEPCYSYCPELFIERGTSCVPRVDLNDPALMRCIAECGVAELTDGPASPDSMGGA